MPIHVDARHAPIVRVVIAGEYADAELDTYHDEIVRLMRRASMERRKYVFVVDARESAAADAVRRRRIASWVHAHSALMKVACGAMAIVLSNAIQRGVLKALMWLRPYPVPYRVFSTVEDAEAWARSSLPRPRLSASP